MLMFDAFRRDERGFVVSAELILIATLCVLGLIAGLTCVRDAVSGELKDLANAIGSLNQSYRYTGMHGCITPRCGVSSWTAGSAFYDQEDGGQPIGFDCTVGPAPAVAPAPCQATVVPQVTRPCPEVIPAPCETPVAPPCSTPCPSPCNNGPVLPQLPCAPVLQAPGPCDPCAMPVQPTCCDPRPVGSDFVYPGGPVAYPGSMMQLQFGGPIGPGLYPAPIGPGAFAPPRPLVW